LSSIFRRRSQRLTIDPERQTSSASYLKRLSTRRLVRSIAGASTVIASAAKQSIGQQKERMDCFAVLAMTLRHWKHTSAFSRRDAPELCQEPSAQEGVGNAGCPVHP
jgi:hypothetical protein